MQIQADSVTLTLCGFRCEDDHRRERVTGAKCRPAANLPAFDQLVHSRLATGGAAVRPSFHRHIKFIWNTVFFSPVF